MMMYEEPLEDAVILEWGTTPERKEQGYYGLKEQIILANNIRTDLRLASNVDQYLVVGQIDENIPWTKLEQAQLEATTIAGVVAPSTIPLLVYDLFRRGYLGSAFYIVRFSADDLPRTVSHG